MMTSKMYSFFVCLRFFTFICVRANVTILFAPYLSLLFVFWRGQMKYYIINGNELWLVVRVAQYLLFFIYIFKNMLLEKLEID